MYLGQVMIDSHTRLNHMQDYQVMQGLYETCCTLSESLSKAKKEKKALEDFKRNYDPAMETLQEEKWHLNEVVGRYIIEKNNFEKKIKALEVDLADHQQKLEDV